MRRLRCLLNDEGGAFSEAPRRQQNARHEAGRRAGEPESERAAYFAPLVATPLMATRPSYGLKASFASDA